MRAFREQDFDKMAERVVDRFMSGDKLADAATEEAMGGELNPDQIARLVQAANTQAFLRLMDQQKAQGGADMTHEFDPIDARQIVQQIVSGTGAPDMGGMGGQPHAEPDGDEGPLPDEMGAQHMQHIDHPGDEPHDSMHVDHPGDEPHESQHVPPMDDDNDGPFPKGKKQKVEDDDKPKKKGPPKPPEKDRAKEAAFRSRRMHKLADILEDQYKQAEWAFEDTFSNLQMLLKRAHLAPTPAEFEKNALALHGHEIGIVVLNMVKQAQGLPAIEFEAAFEKTAALRDRHLVVETDSTRAFEALVKIAVEANRLRSGAVYARSQCS
jgi:hypothetical protein